MARPKPHGLKILVHHRARVGARLSLPELGSSDGDSPIDQVAWDKQRLAHFGFSASATWPRASALGVNMDFVSIGAVVAPVAN
jgi:hypothetical protein